MIAADGRGPGAWVGAEAVAPALPSWALDGGGHAPHQRRDRHAHGELPGGRLPPRALRLAEIAATGAARGSSSRRGPAMRRHLEDQLGVAYPQAELRRLDAGRFPGLDPARRPRTSRWPRASPCGPGLPAAAHLPRRRGGRRPRDAQADPVLGILGALDDLPQGWRALAQLVLRPAPDGWCRGYLRLAVEHPLAGERAPRGGTGPSADGRLRPGGPPGAGRGRACRRTSGTPPASGSPLALLAGGAGGLGPGGAVGWPAWPRLDEPGRSTTRAWCRRSWPHRLPGGGSAWRSSPRPPRPGGAAGPAWSAWRRLPAVRPGGRQRPGARAASPSAGRDLRSLAPLRPAGGARAPS